MSIEVIVAHPNSAPQKIDLNPQQAQTQTQASGPQEPLPVIYSVPEPAKVKINREPLVSAVELEAKIGELNAKLIERNQAVAFSTDAGTGHDVVKVTNRSTGELIRQMPSLEALKAMQNMDQMMGLIFNGKS